MRRSISPYAALALLGLGIPFAWPFTIDDAYVIARYAENLAGGQGYSFNSGARSDGVTGPLWLMPAWIAALSGLSSVVVQKALGALAYSLGALAVVKSMQQRSDGGASTLAALALALPVGGIVWAVGGLETGAATLAMGALVSGVVSRSRRTGWVAALALPWLRPDAVPAALCLCIAGRTPRRDVLALLVGVAGTVVFRWVMFDAWLPLSFWAKGAPVVQGLRYAAEGIVWLTGGVGLLFIAAALRRPRRGAMGLACASVVHLAAVAAVGGDWMPAHRLLVPILPALAVLTGWGGAALWRVRPRLAGPLLVGYLGAFAILLVAALPAARGSGHYRQTNGRALAEVLAADEGPLALVDAGYLAWSTKREVVDLGGITDPEIAAMPGTHVSRLIDVAYLDRRNPSQFLLHSSVRPVIHDRSLRRYVGFETESRLIRSPWFRRHYAPVQSFEYSPAYWYVLFERR